MQIEKSRVVDLSHAIRRKGENFPFHSDYVGNRDKEFWYVMSNIFTGSHVGTHVETPYHHMRDGDDCLTYPLDHLMGPAITLDCSHKAPEEPITLDELLPYDDKIQEGDLVFVWTGCDKFHRTERWMDYRYFTEEAMEWLVSKNPKAIGVDSFGIEIPGDRTGEPNHMRCFNRGIAVIEALDNLGEIVNERVTAFLLILPMEGVDACPVRAIAIRGDDMQFAMDQVTDLSHSIRQGIEKFPFFSTRTGDTHTKFYGMTDVLIASHVGTHVEMPRHHMINGTDCLNFPLEHLMGEAITLNCTGKTVDDPITLEELLPYKDKIHEGDIIFVWTGFEKYHRTHRWREYRYFTEEAMEWLVSFKPKAIGVDAFGIEIPGENTGEPNHMRCFTREIAVVEALKNLGEIVDQRVNVFMLVLPMEGVDACPVRAIAIKDLGKK